VRERHLKNEFIRERTHSILMTYARHKYKEGIITSGGEDHRFFLSGVIYTPFYDKSRNLTVESKFIYVKSKRKEEARRKKLILRAGGGI
jgi:hypothetical protein